MGLHIDLDAEPGRFADQQARRADPALAEMKVVADGDAADSEPLDQVMVNEILRRGPGADFVEGHHDGAGEPGPGQQPQLSGLVGEPELGAVRAEKAARVRLERHRQRRPAVGAAHLQRGFDHRAVAKVDAIEITHRHHRSLGDGGRRRGIADNDKITCHFRGFFEPWRFQAKWVPVRVKKTRQNNKLGIGGGTVTRRAPVKSSGPDPAACPGWAEYIYLALAG